MSGILRSTVVSSSGRRQSMAVHSVAFALETRTGTRFRQLSHHDSLVLAVTAALGIWII